MNKFVITLAAALAAGTHAPAHAEATPQTGCRGDEAKTVFLDASRFGRKNSAAKNMTELHEEMAADGWSFAHMGIYTENSDLEGFFLTYTRPAACTPAQASSSRD